MSVEINGDLLTIMLLYSLPDSFENFRCAIETRDTLPDAESLKVKIIEENNARIRRSNHVESNVMYVKHSSKEKSSSNDNTETGKTKPLKKKITYNCNYCKKKEHKESDCFTKKKDQNKQNTNHIDESFFVNSPKAEVEDRVCCIDSGCTTHLCKNKDSFINYEDNITDNKIRLANAATAEVRAKGNVGLTVHCDDNKKKINLENTLFVPELRTNLKIVDKDHEVIFKKNNAIVQDLKENIKMFAERRGDLFYVRENNQEVNIAIDTKRDKVELWHGRFGHLNFRDLYTMKKNLNVTGMDFSDFKIAPDCKTCLAAKLSRISFLKKANR